MNISTIKKQLQDIITLAEKATPEPWIEGFSFIANARTIAPKMAKVLLFQIEVLESQNSPDYAEATQFAATCLSLIVEEWESQTTKP